MHFFDNINNKKITSFETSQGEFKSHCRKLTFEMDDEASPLVQTQPILSKYVFPGLIDPIDIPENESNKVQSKCSASLLYKKQLAQRINAKVIVKKANPIKKINFDLMDHLSPKKVCLEYKHLDVECFGRNVMNPEEENFQIPEAFERFEDDYEVLSILGEGHSGKVMKCFNRKSNQVQAIKCCEIVGQEAGRQRINQQEGYNEILCLIQLNKQRSCNNIIHYIDSWRDKRKLYVAIEVCDYSVKEIDINSEYIKEDTIKKILKDITNGLTVFHRNKLVHLDIKPENLLFHKKSDNFKIADLGLTRSSQLLLSDDLREGDARYFAPELLLNHTQVHDLTSADIFSLGISIFEMMIRDINEPIKELPKNGPFWKQLRSGLSDSDFGVNGVHYSQPLKQIIIQMMAQDHNTRPSAEALLQYPYLSVL